MHEVLLKKIKTFPQNPGVYLMRDEKNKLLYVGKAGNLRRRVTSYFQKAQESRIEKLIQLVRQIETEETGSVVEALILEAELIKKHQPPFNVREKDDKSFLYVVITKESYPRLLLLRGKDLATEERKKYKAIYGPFTSAGQLRQALKVVRKIVPWNTHLPERIGTFKRPCFEYEIGLCPGTCVLKVSRSEYAAHIRYLKLFFEGKKKRLLALLEKRMKELSKKLDFEGAEKVRRQIFSLEHIQDVALVSVDESPQENVSTRIEGYDISNTSGEDAVGSMVVFLGGKPAFEEYRKFKIRTVKQSDDVGMLKEVMTRRLKNDWPLPDLILVDGGKGQVRVIRDVLSKEGFRIPVVGLAKGPERKRNDLHGKLPTEFDMETLIRVRDEAHRFAIGYHKKVRSRTFLQGR